MAHRPGAFCVHVRQLDQIFRIPSRNVAIFPANADSLASAVGDMITSKVPRSGEHTSERNSHGNNSTNHTNPTAGRRFAVLALQLGLGLLAERRTRIDCFDLNNSRLNGTPVNGVAFG